MGIFRSPSELYDGAISVAGTFLGPEVPVPAQGQALAFESKFVYGAGGTSVNVYLQSSLDGGTTWTDIANSSFATATASKAGAVSREGPAAGTPGATPTDGSIAADSVISGVLGDRVRAKVVVVGTYTGSSLLVTVAFS